MAPITWNKTVTREFVDALGDLLADYLGIVVDIESTSIGGQKGIYSVKELRVMHMVFHYWRRGEVCTVTRIANETGISKTTVSRAVTTLMTNRLLKEQSDPEDGRRRLLLPTKKGQNKLDNFHAWLSLWADRLHELMGKGEPSIIAQEPRPELETGPGPATGKDQISADAASR